jgi:glycosyltransferase involved in cell wall biosynthesis
VKPSILYISYDGMLEPLGQSQVLAYLERLSGDYRIRLISYEKKADWDDRARRAAVRARIEAAGMKWIPLRYHKAPSAPATAFDMGVGTIVALYQAIRHRVRIVHCRSYIPAAIGLVVKKLTGAKLLFDMRGFWADERVDGGLWPAGGGLYRATKKLERKLLEEADQVVTLTQASAAEMRRFDYLENRVPPMHVIPTCVDLDRFVPSARQEGPFTLGYVGSIGTWYLFDETLAFFRLLLEQRPDARMLVVNRHEQAYVSERAAALGIDPARIEILSAEHKDVPALIGRMSAGAAIIKPLYSKMASAPTKVGEYLACGIPCLANSKVGDLEAILEGGKVGVVLRSMDEAEMRGAVGRLLDLTAEPGLAERCRETARRIFSLEQGVEDYRSVYRALAA